MPRLTDLLPLLTSMLTGLTVAGDPLVTILDHVPEGALQEAELPGVILDVRAPEASLAHTSTRRLTWPIDFHILASGRSADIGTTIPAVFGLGEDVIALLDQKCAFNGLLARTTEYASPAFSVDTDGNAYGLIQFGDRVLVGTVLHAVFTLDRVGGF